MASNSNEHVDGTPDENSSTSGKARNPDRSEGPTRFVRLCDHVDVSAMTPAENLEMMWPLTVDAWAKMGIDVSHARMERHIVRTIRRGKRSAQGDDQQY